MASTALKEIPETELDFDIDEFPDGTIMVSGGEFLRFGGFVHSLNTVKRPKGSRLNLMQSISIVDNMNTCVESMTGDWLWIQADDQIFRDDALALMLKAMYDEDLDILVPLIIRRSPPFVPIAFRDFDPELGYAPWPLWELPEKGLVECVAAGSGGMLVRKRVFDRIREAQGHDDIFEYQAGTQLREDLYFCEKATALGHKIHLLVDVTMGHRGGFTVWPQFHKNDYVIAFDLGVSASGKRSTLAISPRQAAVDGDPE